MDYRIETRRGSAGGRTTTRAVTRRGFFGAAGVSGATGAAGALGSVLLAACGGPGAAGGNPAQAGAAQGSVLFWQEGNSDLAVQFWDHVKAAFKAAQPNVDLQYDRTPVPSGQSRDDKLFAGLASGSAWDVWQRDIPPSYQQPLVDKKAVLALDEYYSTMPNLKRIHGWARARSKLFGKTWGVPHEIEFVPVWFNKGVFARAGIKDLPKTWDQYQTLLKTLKSAGVQPMNIQKGRTNPGHNFSIYLMG
jgi:ABC-type glycerol-3-phosphate transport system substrate-binding protein